MGKRDSWAARDRHRDIIRTPPTQPRDQEKHGCQEASGSENQTPFGYGDIVPLKQTDSVLLPAAGAMPDFCRSINALAVSYTEFNIAARDYPIVFASADAGKT